MDAAATFEDSNLYHLPDGCLQFLLTTCYITSLKGTQLYKLAIRLVEMLINKHLLHNEVRKYRCTDVLPTTDARCKLKNQHSLTIQLESFCSATGELEIDLSDRICLQNVRTDFAKIGFSNVFHTTAPESANIGEDGNTIVAYVKLYVSCSHNRGSDGTGVHVPIENIARPKQNV